MDMKTAVIYRLEELIRQKDITVNEAAIRSGVPPSTLKNILYGQSKNVGVVTIKKLCDGLEITIPEFFGDSIFADVGTGVIEVRDNLMAKFCGWFFYEIRLAVTNNEGGLCIR